MKQALTLPELAAQVQHAKRDKRDFHVPTDQMEYTQGEMLFGKEQFTPTHTALRQVGEFCGIPVKYFDRMSEEQPGLLADNINAWLQHKPDTHMVRTLDGQMRAFLSKRYRPLDNADCVGAVYPLIEQFRGSVESCALTETKLYLKVVIPGREVELKADGVEWGKGHNPIHVLRPGIVISNSETGHGSVSIQPGVHERHCSNLMVMSESAMRKYHVQRGVDAGDGAQEYLTDETRAAADQAFWLQIQDLTRAALDGRIFEAHVKQIQATMGQVMPDPEATVQLVAKNYNLTNDERDSVLNQLINSGEPTQYGLQAAVTRAAQDVESYDRSSELERLGGRIIELPKTEWTKLAQAA